MCTHKEEHNRSKDSLSNGINGKDFGSEKKDRSRFLYERLKASLKGFSKSQQEVLFVSFLQKKRLWGLDNYKDLRLIRREAFKGLLRGLIDGGVFEVYAAEDLMSHSRYMDQIDSYLADELTEDDQASFERHILDCNECGALTLLGRDMVSCMSGNRDLFNKVDEDNLIQKKLIENLYNGYRRLDRRERKTFESIVLSRINRAGSSGGIPGKGDEIERFGEEEEPPDSDGRYLTKFRKRPCIFLCSLFGFIIGIINSGCSRGTNLLFRGRDSNAFIRLLIGFVRHIGLLTEGFMEYLLYLLRCL